MILVNLKGGTGNQLFQYALGRYLAIKNKTELKLDISGLARANAIGNIHRPFSLSAFAISSELATEDEVRRLKYPYGIISKGLRWINFRLSKDKNTLFKESAMNLPDNTYLDGYWQSPRYFEDIRETLLADFTLVEPFAGAAARYAAQIEESTAVSLHVRRGDYVKNPRTASEFGVCSLAYYTNAIAEIRTKVQDPTFFVFSDDIDWVKEHLPLGDGAVFVQDPALTDTMELVLMSCCQHNIIANSSFSWWAAWLNQHPQKIVIAPAPWFDHVPYDADLIPPSWIELPK